MTNIGQECTIEVPGVRAGLQSFAKNQYRDIVKSNLLRESLTHRDMQFLLNKILVTDCFEYDVNRLLNRALG